MENKRAREVAEVVRFAFANKDYGVALKESSGAIDLAIREAVEAEREASKTFCPKCQSGLEKLLVRDAAWEAVRNEREACAKYIEQLGAKFISEGGLGWATSRRIAAAIRERGKNGHRIQL